MQQDENIVLHSIMEKKKDTTDIIKNKIEYLKEFTYNILKEIGNSYEIHYSNLKLLSFSNTEENLRILQEMKILEKLSYSNYKILIKNSADIEEKFSKAQFIYDKDEFIYQQRIEHLKLEKSKEFSSSSKEHLNLLVENQISEWQQEWSLKEPEYENNKLEFLLKDSLDVNIKLENLINKSQFHIDKPTYPKLKEFKEDKPLFNKKSFSFSNKKSKQLYEEKLNQWNSSKSEVEKNNQLLIDKYERELNRWNDLFDEFVNKQAQENERLIALYDGYENSISETLQDYFNFIIKYKIHPLFDKDLEISFDEGSNSLFINVELPLIEEFPKIKSRTFISSRDEYKEKLYTDKELNKLYENSFYQFIVYLLSRINTGDYLEKIDSIAINGWVNYLNKAKGQYEIKYIISLFTPVEKLKDINYSLVDPKICFKNLKGIASNNLIDITPIKPIISFSTTDKRFIEAINIAENLDQGSNLASMDWEDFEYLVRELFDKEFGNNGEVKVTQASKDGGVDAIAFDLDPVKGGKIVIQAKRYTNVVGVSAVRDLYGTILNEGANKGILVTTSNFGSDSYEFAKDKPITLLNGQELLFLLEKHGYKARIDIAEAKNLAKDKRS